MPKKIVRAEENYKIEKYDFKVYTTVKKGVSQFVFKPFSDDQKREYETEKSVEEIHELDDIKESSISDKNETATNNNDIDLEKLKEVARKEGYEEGYEKGLQDGLKKMENYKKNYEAQREDYLEILKKGVNEAIVNIEELKKMISALDEELPKLIINYVKELIGIERKLNDDLILSVFKKHFDKVKNASKIVIMVNPEDVDILKSEYSDLEIVPDESVLKGGFKVKTNIGEFDFTIDTLIKNFEKTIYEELETS
ncbi:FliH/SctL family protein [Deferribacter thermophilus]|uniref:FliH/SctL family protein n=1 Tax=Deferribacter thermophilus TaxID=53573 RepID=UPI003C27AA12